MYPPHSQPSFVPNFQTISSQFGTQQTIVSNENSSHSQTSIFDTTNIIDLNDDVNKAENVRKGIIQWTWSEDKLLISAWINVPTCPITDTGEAYWDQIRQYCETSEPGVIKRGAIAMKKRWQRIKEGVNRYGACFEEVQQSDRSGSELTDKIEAAHDLPKIKYKKKSNFEMHWFELHGMV